VEGVNHRMVREGRVIDLVAIFEVFNGSSELFRALF
jgi:hypothetical protein